MMEDEVRRARAEEPMFGIVSRRLEFSLDLTVTSVQRLFFFINFYTTPASFPFPRHKKRPANTPTSPPPAQLTAVKSYRQ